MRYSIVLCKLLLLCLLTACSRPRMQVDIFTPGSPTADRLNQVLFIDAQTGFACGGKQYERPVLLKTIDGGRHWTSMSLPVQNEQKEIYAMSFHPSGSMLLCGYGGTMYFSNDSGNQFNYHQHNSWHELRGACFRQDKEAWIVGGAGFNKGHMSRIALNSNGPFDTLRSMSVELRQICFPDSLNGYCCGYGGIMKTTDKGLHWDFTSAKNDYYRAMSWTDALHGVAAGYGGSIIRTNDGGNSWQTIRDGNNFLLKKIHLLAIACNHTHYCVAVGEGGITLLSDNDGSTWIELKSFTSTDLYGVSFRDEATCFLCGDGGHLFQLNL